MGSTKKCTVSLNKATEAADVTLNGVMEMLRGIKKDTESTADSLSQYMDTMDNKVESLSETVKADSDRITSLENKIAVLLKNSSPAPNSTELAKQAILRNNICIHGIPSGITLSLDSIVTGIASALGIQILTSDYSSVYRTAGNGDRPGFIIVKLNQFSKKLEVLKAKRTKNKLTLKDLKLNIQPDDQHVFVNNQLTPHFGKILQTAKKAVAEKKLFSCWIALNCLCVKPSEQSERILVRDMTELNAAINGSTTSTISAHPSTSGAKAPSTAKSAPSNKKNGKRRASNETDNTANPINPAKKSSSTSTVGIAQPNESNSK